MSQNESPADKVEITGTPLEGAADHTITVTRKAYEVIYRGRGYQLASDRKSKKESD